MGIEGVRSLEEALAKTESEADLALKAATAVVGSIKKFRTATKTGNLFELRKTVAAAEEALALLTQQLTKANESWNFNEDLYLSSEAFSLEILTVAEEAGVKIFQQDDRFYCYPFLIRLLPAQRSILIDKTREKRLRPSVLMLHLKELQNMPVRFRSDAFLESLYGAYIVAVKGRGKERLPTMPMVPLVEIYDLLTLLPGQSREYSRQEFARDLYLLDESGIRNTRKGFVADLHAARGTEPTNKVFSIVTKEGNIKKYYGASFMRDK